MVVSTAYKIVIPAKERHPGLDPGPESSPACKDLSILTLIRIT